MKRTVRYFLYLLAAFGLSFIVATVVGECIARTYQRPQAPTRREPWGQK